MEIEPRPWKKAKPNMPDVMRLLYTSPDANQFHPVMMPDDGDRWPEHPVVCVIGPFDNHTGQPELQARLLAVLREWNAEAAARALAAPPTS